MVYFILKINNYIFINYVKVKNNCFLNMNIITNIIYLRPNLAKYLSELTGTPDSQFTLVLSILFTIPICLLNFLIKGKTQRLLYSLIPGVILQYSIYGMGMIHVIVSTISTYLFLIFFGRKISAFVVMIYTMIHLSYLNLTSMLDHYGKWNVDEICTIYMMELTKFTSIAFCYEDGLKNDKDFKNEHHKKYKIEKIPSILEYISYIYFYPTAIIGPFIEYKDFIDFIEEKNCYENLTSKKKLTYLLKQGTIRLLSSFFFMGTYAFFLPYVPVEFLGEKDFVIKYPKFYQRIFYLLLTGPAVRSRYYSGWLLNTSTLAFNGIAYDEINKNGEIIQNVEKGSYGSILLYEFGMNPRYKMGYWNKTVHEWLKYYIYTRLLCTNGKFKNNKQLSNFVTYIVSAFWHGFYAGYYFGFFMVFLFQQLGIFTDALGFYKWIEDKVYLWPLVSLKTIFFNNSIGASFFILEFKKAYQITLNFYGFPFYFSLFCYIATRIYLMLFGIKKKDVHKKILEKEKESTKKTE